MTRKIKILVLLLFFIISNISISDAAQKLSVADFPYRHSDFDYKVAWKTTQSNNRVDISGIMKNVRYPYIEQVDLTIFLQGPNQKPKARTTTLPFPQESREGDVVSFDAKLDKVTLQPGDTMVFVIHYRGSEGGGGGGSLSGGGGGSGIDWHSTFAVDAMTGTPIQKGNAKSEEW